VTAWRRLQDWSEAGVRPRLHAVLLTEPWKAGLPDRDDATVDASHVRALKGLIPDLRRSTGYGRAASTI
jgi:transposase